MNFGFRHFKNSSDCHKLKISLLELKKKKREIIFFLMYLNLVLNICQLIVYLTVPIK
jgi:hypothetical protein